MEELDSPYHRSLCRPSRPSPTGCCSRAANAPSDLGPGEKWQKVKHKENLTILDIYPLLPWAIRHSEIVARLQPILALSSI